MVRGASVTKKQRSVSAGRAADPKPTCCQQLPPADGFIPRAGTSQTGDPTRPARRLSHLYLSDIWRDCRHVPSAALPDIQHNPSPRHGAPARRPGRSRHPAPRHAPGPVAGKTTAREMADWLLFVRWTGGRCEVAMLSRQTVSAYFSHINTNTRQDADRVAFLVERADRPASACRLPSVQTRRPRLRPRPRRPVSGMVRTNIQQHFRVSDFLFIFDTRLCFLLTL